MPKNHDQSATESSQAKMNKSPKIKQVKKTGLKKTKIKLKILPMEKRADNLDFPLRVFETYRKKAGFALYDWPNTSRFKYMTDVN